MVNKVATARKSVGSFTATHAAEPAKLDTVESLRKEAVEIAVRLRVIAPNKILKPAIVATPGQAAMMRQMVEIDSELAELTAGPLARRSAIKSELDRIVDTAGAEAIVSESEGLRYTAEPSSASVSVKVAGVSHYIRTISSK